MKKYDVFSIYSLRNEETNIDKRRIYLLIYYYNYYFREHKK